MTKAFTDGMIVLRPDAGNVLTNGESYTSENGAVFLPLSVNWQDWYEITVEEYQALQAEQDVEQEQID